MHWLFASARRTKNKRCKPHRLFPFGNYPSYFFNPQGQDRGPPSAGRPPEEDIDIVPYPQPFAIWHFSQTARPGGHEGKRSKP
nr:MAG TPA: hypothetical protein [Caudoviricetes sp.]